MDEIDDTAGSAAGPGTRRGASTPDHHRVLSRVRRKAITSDHNLWPDGVIVYTLSGGHSRDRTITHQSHDHTSLAARVPHLPWVYHLYYAITPRRLFAPVSSTVYSQVLLQLSELQQCRMKHVDTAVQVSDPGSLRSKK